MLEQALESRSIILNSCNLKFYMNIHGHVHAHTPPPQHTVLEIPVLVVTRCKKVTVEHRSQMVPSQLCTVMLIIYPYSSQLHL
jgi:hypothetical protein